MYSNIEVYKGTLNPYKENQITDKQVKHIEIWNVLDRKFLQITFESGEVLNIELFNFYE